MQLLFSEFLLDHGINTASSIQQPPNPATLSATPLEMDDNRQKIDSFGLNGIDHDPVHFSSSSPSFDPITSGSPQAFILINAVNLGIRCHLMVGALVEQPTKK